MEKKLTIEDYNLDIQSIESSLIELKEIYDKKKAELIGFMALENYAEGMKISGEISNIIESCYEILLEKGERKEGCEEIALSYVREKIVPLRTEYPDSMVNDFSPLEYELLKMITESNSVG